MNIVDMSGEIAMITNSMFPVAPLPKCKFAVGVPFDFDIRDEQVSAEVPLDPTPASGEIGVPVR
jgi:hypothetical protein